MNVRGPVLAPAAPVAGKVNAPTCPRTASRITDAYFNIYDLTVNGNIKHETAEET